jgi:nucleotide-binding universal stress UspA family protein
MYTRILTPLDGSDVSEQVLPYARALASKLSLPTMLLMAIEAGHPSIGHALNPLLHSHETENHRADHAQNYLSSVAARMQGAGVAADTIVPRGEPADAIIGQANEDPGTLIAMASHGRSGLARWWMGSVADKVLHTADNPLLLIRSQSHPAAAQESAPKRLIVPVDGSEVAEQVLPHVAYLASALEIPVVLVQVTISEAEYYQAMSMGLRVLPPTLPSYQSFSERMEDEARAYVADARARLIQQGLDIVEETLVQGSPAECIVDLASAHPGSLVAMTTHGRSGIGRMILGSVAERVVRQSGGPVLLVRAHHDTEAPLAGSPALA